MLTLPRGRAPAALAGLLVALCLAVPAASHAGAPAAGTGASRPAAQQPPSRESRPAWAELTVSQQKALAPLRAAWSGLSESRKRKWLVVARSFDDLAPAEQAKLHSRMAEWVALSPQQRSQARLNFGETQQLSEENKRAAWEAYQALPEAERRKLAASARPPAPPTAAALRPVPAEKLAPVPRSGSEVRAPRIEAPAHAAGN